MIKLPFFIDNQTYRLSIDHITMETKSQLIYGITINNGHYFVCKTLDINNCEQIDNNAPLGAFLLQEICTVITEIETACQERPSLEFINREITRILMRIRNLRFFKN
jgi:hypothetical protein